MDLLTVYLVVAGGVMFLAVMIDGGFAPLSSGWDRLAYLLIGICWLPLLLLVLFNVARMWRNIKQAFSQS